MTALGTVTLIATINGQNVASMLPAGALPPAIASAAIGRVQGPLSLTSGNNTITIDAGTTSAIIVWPTNNTVAVGLGTGGVVTCNPAGWYLHAPRATDTSFVINAASAISGVYVVSV